MATEILMPALSPTMKMGNLIKWYKKEGEQVSAGEVIAEIETDKATMDVEAVDEGVLGRIVVEAGTTDVSVNSIIAILVEEGEDVPELKSASSSVPAPKDEEKSSSALDTKRIKEPAQNTQKEASKTNRVFASPLARRLAKERNISLSSLRGTGPNGRIIRRDIEKAEQKTSSAPVDSVPDTVQESKIVPHSTMRKVIARRLTESKTQVPHFYVSVDITLDNLLALRSKLNESLVEEGIKISVNDMMIKAVALALRKLPGLNVQFSENEMRHYADIDIAMAVSVPDGLITPVIRQADRKSLKVISQEARELAKKAREGRLLPEEYQGGTFSISNMGMFGVKDFAAIINPPQAAILAIASGEKRPVVRDNSLDIATIMTVTLSVDHRAVDGALGAQWLNMLRDLVQNPYSLVV